MTIYTDDIFILGGDAQACLDKEEEILKQHLAQLSHKRRFLELLKDIKLLPCSIRDASSKSPSLEFGCGFDVGEVCDAYRPVPLILKGTNSGAEIFPAEDHPDGGQAVYPVFHRRMRTTTRTHFAWEACWWAYVDKTRVFITVPLDEGFETEPPLLVDELPDHVWPDSRNFFLLQFKLDEHL